MQVDTQNFAIGAEQSSFYSEKRMILQKSFKKLQMGKCSNVSHVFVFLFRIRKRKETREERIKKNALKEII